MIPFEEIDARLKILELDREWLAEKSGRSVHSIRAALAPNAVKKNRSEHLQRALSDTIEREEAARRDRPILPERIGVEARSKEEFDSWCRAYKASPYDTLEDWAVEALNKAAERWHAQRTRGVTPDRYRLNEEATEPKPQKRGA